MSEAGKLHTSFQMCARIYLCFKSVPSDDRSQKIWSVIWTALILSKRELWQKQVFEQVSIDLSLPLTRVIPSTILACYMS